MKILLLDGTRWHNRDDFYDALFQSLGSPSWHGRNFNALRDSIAGGQINSVALPYRIRILGCNALPQQVRKLVEDFCSLVKELHGDGYDIDVVCD
jgi:RNAse (barnase) inhibitor barstar